MSPVSVTPFGILKFKKAKGVGRPGAPKPTGQDRPSNLHPNIVVQACFHTGWDPNGQRGRQTSGGIESWTGGIGSDGRFAGTCRAGKSKVGPGPV